MRGARHYRPDVPTRLKKCSEHIGDDCNLCCSVTPCAYCIELEIYGEPIEYGYAPESADHWTGNVDGHSFDAFWERNYLTDECEFVVELNGVEVYRKSCYEGQECRDSSDEVGVTIGYDEATLRWIKHEPLPLPHIIGDEGCPTWFCGECECSCECVCVTITEPDSTVITGELCNVAYECEGPRWEGQIGYYDLALALGRDSYGNCVLESTINGEAQDAVQVTGCKDMSATITLYDGTTIAVSCKICDCSLTVVPVYPCECRFDVGVTITGTLVSGGTACSIDPFSAGLNSGVPGLVAVGDRAWRSDWCVNHFTATFKITAFPPLCTDPDTSRLCVLVKKTTNDDGPLIDNTIVENNEWYIVVYESDGTGLIGIFYEYTQCCINATPEDPATSHLVRLTFHNVTIGDGVRDIVILNPTTLATYGDC